MHAHRLFLFLAIAMPLVSHSEEEAGEHSQIGGLCVQAREPGMCLKSYGFVCHQSRSYDRSLEAYVLGCNLALQDGRYHFVQLLYDDGGWTVENQHTYVPEQDELRTEAEDSALALSNYVREEMKDYSTHSSVSGSGIFEHFNGAFVMETGARRDGEQLVVRAVCGVIVDGQPDNTAPERTRARCEKWILRAIRMLSQPQGTSPYRVAGAAEVEWKSKTATLASGDTAFVMEGHHTFTPNHTPCLWISDCCSSDGKVYLDSCRSPTEVELEAVKSCLAQEKQPRTEEYLGCLRKAEVKVGCDEQADGSRICY